MSEKTYTLEEFLEVTGKFIHEQGQILEDNLKEKRKNVYGEPCTK